MRTSTGKVYATNDPAYMLFYLTYLSTLIVGICQKDQTVYPDKEGNAPKFTHNLVLWIAAFNLGKLIDASA